MSGTRGPAEVLQATDLPYLAFISSGPLRPGATSLLTGACLSSLIFDAGEVFDTVILDGPAVLGSVHARLIANATQAALMVVSAGDTNFRELQDAQQKFHLTRCRIIGVALNKAGKATTMGFAEKNTMASPASQRGRYPIIPNQLAKS